MQAKEKNRELQNEIQNKSKEIEEKEDIIDRLENANRDLEVKNAKLNSEKKSIEIQHKKTENSGEHMKVEKQNEREKEMHEEIEILITQCKDLQSKLKGKDLQCAQHANALEQLDVILQQKDAELQKREGYLTKVLKQLEDKKNELHMNQLKLKQISKTVVADLNKKLTDKDKEIKLMKEMIKGHHLEIEAKQKDIARLCKKIEKLKKSNEMRTEFLTTIINKENEEQVEKLKKLEQFDIEEASNESDEESREESKDYQKEKKELQPTLLPEINPPRRKERNVKESGNSPFHEKYMKKLESYYNNLGESTNNNSMNMKSLLSQNIGYSNNNEEQAVPNESHNRLQSFVRNKMDYDNVHIDVNDIIKKSLESSTVIQSTGRDIKKKAMNIRISNQPAYQMTPTIPKKSKYFGT